MGTGVTLPVKPPTKIRRAGEGPADRVLASEEGSTVVRPDVQQQCNFRAEPASAIVEHTFRVTGLSPSRATMIDKSGQAIDR
jgi:hypothetical protein